MQSIEQQRLGVASTLRPAILGCRRLFEMDFKNGQSGRSGARAGLRPLPNPLSGRIIAPGITQALERIHYAI